MTRRTRLFVDLDDVLADFLGQYVRDFGPLHDRNAPLRPEFWDVAHSTPYFRSLRPLPGARDFWQRLKTLHPSPVILTGIPRDAHAIAQQKREWVAEHICDEAAVVCCPSEEKCLHGRPGDVLVDDWAKYQHLWEGMGGVFILHLHTEPESTIEAVRRALGGPTL